VQLRRVRDGAVVGAKPGLQAVLADAEFDRNGMRVVGFRRDSGGLTPPEALQFPDKSQPA